MPTTRYPPLAEVFPVLQRKNPPAAESPPNLKENLKQDLRKGAVWFDDSELASYRDINGARILCIFDRYETALAAASSSRTTSTTGAEGLQSDLYLLFIRADEYKSEPRVGQEIRIDKRKYYVQPGTIEYDGVYEILVKRASVR